MRREFDTLFKTQAERWLRDLDLVKREEFEAVKDMARLAREENEALKARIAALEAKRRDKPAKPGKDTAAPGRRASVEPDDAPQTAAMDSADLRPTRPRFAFPCLLRRLRL